MTLRLHRLFPLLALLLLFPQLAQGQVVLSDRSASGALTAAWNGTLPQPANTAVLVSLPSQNGIAVQLTGTFVGTVQFEALIDQARASWLAINGTPFAGGTSVSSATATGAWIFNVAGVKVFRVRCSAYTSGTIAVGVVSAAAVPPSTATISGTVTTAGTLTNNNAAPGATNFGVLPGLANAAAPTFTEGDQVLLSTDLSGRLRTSNTPSGTQTVSGTVTANAGTGTFTTAGAKTNNNAAPGATNVGTLGGVANAAAPTWTEGNQVSLSTDLSGNLRTINTPSGTQTVSGTVTANAGSGPFPVAGSVAAGAAVPNPVVIGGQFGGNAKFLALDTNGQPTVNQGTANGAGANSWPIAGAAGPGAAVAGNPVAIGGRDASGNAQFIGGNNSGVFAQGPIAAGSAVGGNPLLLGVSDGTNVQIAQQFTNAQVSKTGYLGAALMVGYGSTNVGPVVNVGNSADSSSGATALSTGLSIYNGATYDRNRNNVDAILLASAARTTTQTSADIVTYNAHSIIVTLDTTVASTGSVTLTINYKDPASGKYILLLSGAAVVTVSTNVYTINPNIPAVANVSAQKDLGRVIQIVTTANNANTQSYSVGYTLVN